MGNFCSSKQEYGHLYPGNLPQLFSSLSNSSSSPSPTSPSPYPFSHLPHPFHSHTPTGPILIPSLFDLCLQQLCLSLLDSSSMTEISRRRSTLRMSDDQLFMLQHWMACQLAAQQKQGSGSGGGSINGAGVISGGGVVRSRSLSLSSKESPELGPQAAGVPMQPSLLPLQALPPLLPTLPSSAQSKAASSRYTASSRSLSASNPLTRRSSLSSSASTSTTPHSPRDSTLPILHALQSTQTSASTPTSPLHRSPPSPFTFEGDSALSPDAGSDLPILPRGGMGGKGGRSVSSYVGGTAQWMWEKGRRRSWFAGASPSPSSHSSPHHHHHPHHALPPIISLTPPSHSLCFPSSSRLRLPDSLIELIFHRLVSQRLLTLSTLHLFWAASLSRIDLKDYEGVTDAWLEVLLMGWMVASGGAGSGSGGLGGARTGWRDEGERKEGGGGEGGKLKQRPRFVEEEATVRTDEEEGESDDADDDDEDEKDAGEKAQTTPDRYLPPTPTASIDIRGGRRAGCAGAVPGVVAEEEEQEGWSLSSSMDSTRPVSRALWGGGASEGTTRSSSLSSTPSQQAPPLSTSPVIKSLPLSSLPSPSSLSLTPHPSPLSVRYLDLSKCDLVTNRPLYSLVYATQLAHLSLSGCTQLSDELLVSILPHLPALLHLNLSNCHSISNLTLAALHSSHRLHHLLLDVTAVTDDGLLTLQHLTRLRTLSLACNGTRVTDAGLAWLPSCFSLRHLAIPHTAVKSASLFHSLQRLRHLDISGLKLTPHPSPPSHSTPTTSPLTPLRLTSLVMQSCEVKELPSAFLHHGLLVLDAGFSKMSAGKLAQGLERLSRCTTGGGGGSEKEVGGLGRETAGRGGGWEGKEEDEQEEDEDEVDEVCYEMDRVPSPSPSPSPPLHPMLTTPQSAPLLPLTSPSSSSSSPFPPTLSLTPPGPLLHTLNLESSEADNRLLPLLSSFPHLTHLNLCDTSVDQDGLLHLSSLTSLRTLNLSGNHLNNSSLHYLSPLTSLTSLSLDCSSISDAGLAHLTPLASLTHLDLFECAITDAGLAHLTPLTHLTSLELCSTKLTNAAIHHLTPLPHLTSLNLCRNPHIDDRAIPLLTRIPRLRHLNLSHSGVTAKGLEGFGGMVGLKTLSLFGCKVGGVGERVKAALPLGLQVGLDQWVIAAVEETGVEGGGGKEERRGGGGGGGGGGGSGGGLGGRRGSHQ